MIPKGADYAPLFQDICNVSLLIIGVMKLENTCKQQDNLATLVRGGVTLAYMNSFNTHCIFMLFVSRAMATAAASFNCFAVTDSF